MSQKRGNDALNAWTLFTGAQWTIEWDHAVVVTEVEIIMTRHGVIEVEAFVGGTANPWVGQYDAEQLNEGWVSLGVSRGFAPAPADSRPFSLSLFISFSVSLPPIPPGPLAHARTHAHARPRTHGQDVAE